jgi:hypothetical protein
MQLCTLHSKITLSIVGHGFFLPAGLLLDIIWSYSCQSCREEGSFCLKPSPVTECNKIAWAGGRLLWLMQTNVAETTSYRLHYGSEP